MCDWQPTSGGGGCLVGEEPSEMLGSSCLYPLTAASEVVKIQRKRAILNSSLPQNP